MRQNNLQGMAPETAVNRFLSEVKRNPEVKHPKLSARRLAPCVSPIAALRLAPKEDFSLNAKRSTQNCFMRRRWRVSVMDN
jgi:hypothetical protein